MSDLEWRYSSMKYIKLLMALAVACILIMPAFSMPDNGMGQDGKQLVIMHRTNNQQGCDQFQGPMGQDGKQNHWMNKENQCQCKGQDGKDGKWANNDNQGQYYEQNGKDGKQMNHTVKSMMGRMGQKGMCHRPIKSMMGNHGGITAVIVSVKVIE
jgi:hypothetical protein